MLMHKSPSSKLFTTQAILSASLVSVPEKYAEAYQQACSSLLESLGANYKYDSLKKLLSAVASSVVSLIQTMAECKFVRRPPAFFSMHLFNMVQMEHLIAVFDLITTACVSFPSFGCALLQEVGRGQVQLLQTVFGLLGYSGSNDAEPKTNLNPLEDALLEFLETVCYVVPPEESSR